MSALLAGSMGALFCAVDRASAACAMDTRERIAVLDGGLIAPGGHHFEFARMLRDQLARDYKLTIYAHVSANPTLVAALRARPLFTSGPYPAQKSGTFDKAYVAMTQAMVRALRSLDPADLNPNTLAILHTTTVFQLGALAQWYTTLAPQRRPKLFVQFQHPLEFMVEPTDAVPAAIAAAKDACTLLASAGGVRFAANSSSLAGRLSEQLDCSCELMPVPVNWCDDAAAAGAEPTVSFGFFGGLRREKGALILAQAIIALSATHPGVRFIVHAPHGASDEDVVRLLLPLAQVEIVRTTFTRKADYFHCLRRVRCILLPYDPVPYALRTSGIFLEALGLGIPIIVTAGTWMASELQARGGAGTVLPEFSATALHASLAQVYAQHCAPGGRPGTLNVPNQAVIAEHSSANFCATLLRRMDAPVRRQASKKETAATRRCKRG